MWTRRIYHNKVDWSFEEFASSIKKLNIKITQPHKRKKKDTLYMAILNKNSLIP